jgi:EAL domain-containing protein (putative c-di-GMP-specific phosphodiesterase class I)/ActR/RegA family two-component response regulator
VESAPTVETPLAKGPQSLRATRHDAPVILLVEDDEALRRIEERTLVQNGFRVVTAPDGHTALFALAEQPFDLVLSDIDIPGIDGLGLLERVRRVDLDVPVVLVTGAPSMEGALCAIENGALKYLVKPVSLEALVKIASDAVRLHFIAKLKRQALDLVGGVKHLVGERAGLEATFDRALQSLHMVFQPIVKWSTHSVLGYEALLRVREPALPDATSMLHAAERLDRIHDLGRALRAKAMEPFDLLPAEALLFLNLHPKDLLDEELFDTRGPLAKIANRTVLEVTERASLQGIHDVSSRIDALRKIGFRIALDDFGAGYSGLTSFALLEPDIAKLDMALVRDVHKAPMKQTLVRTLAAACSELGILFVAEGIETADERDALARAGCDLMQGYLFARPGESFPEPAF